MGTVNILLVDDDVEFRKAVEEGLATVANVVTTATPVEALWTMERTPIDILLCDLFLATSTTGIDVLAAVKELWPRVARVLVTGFGNRVDENVAHAMLGKPFDMRSLRKLLELLPALADQERAGDGRENVMHAGGIRASADGDAIAASPA
jgi:DNA-binding NtrC family response regulator